MQALIIGWGEPQPWWWSLPRRWMDAGPDMGENTAGWGVPRVPLGNPISDSHPAAHTLVTKMTLVQVSSCFSVSSRFLNSVRLSRILQWRTAGSSRKRSCQCFLHSYQTDLKLSTQCSQVRSRYFPLNANMICLISVDQQIQSMGSLDDIDPISLTQKLWGMININRNHQTQVCCGVYFLIKRALLLVAFI